MKLKRTLSLLTLSLGLLTAATAWAQASLTDGEVVKVDKGAGKLTLKHGEIKNLDMPPMTMAFRVSDPKWLDQVAAGQKLRFVVEKLNGQYTITRLEK